MSYTGKFLVILAVWIFGSGGTSSAMALNEILNIRHWVAPDHTRVVIDTSEDPSFIVHKGERHIAVDLDTASMPPNLPPITILNKPGVDGIVLSTLADSGVRVEISLPGPLQTNVFKLKQFQDKPYRIVIDISLPDAAKQERDARERIKVTRKSRIVVIDPGHGGEAPGAVGKKGTLEKNVALAIALKLRDILNQKEGYRAFLTRDGDYYVSFKKRLMIAREYGADLFVSIHADAARNREAGGSSVYCLSTGAASSEAARILANNENLADVVGGVPNGEGNDASDPIILDMFQTHTINQSRTFGTILLRELGAANHLKFTSVQEAPFRVLKLPEIPSILIETAYISNAKEEKLLRTSRFQMQIAEGVARSVVAFLPALPATRASLSLLDGDGKPGHPPFLGEEGKRKENARAKEKKTAKAKAEPVASGKGAPISKSRVAAVYRVKRGDTLGAIATRYGTTIRVLMDLNRLKHPDQLHVGRKLLLPDPLFPSKKVVAR
jgi:N-acetylmuramoyl-L-alanine amidase